MHNIVDVKDLSLRYPIYSARALSLRNSVANLAIGGRLLRNGEDICYVQALRNLDFTLQAGDRLGIIGHNGAGKTTLLKVLAGVYEPDQGYVHVDGKISSMINISLGLDMELSGRDNAYNLARRRGHTAKSIVNGIDEIIEFSELGSFFDLPLKAYSAGMIARLLFAVATWFSPDVLLLDEWIGAGDAGFFEKAQAKMESLVRASRVIVLATHSMWHVKTICNKLLVLDHGKQIYFGDLTGWDFELSSEVVKVA